MKDEIQSVVVTPVCFADPPLLNAAGLHQPFALRSIVEVTTAAGVTGLGETYGDLAVVENLRRAGEAMIGMSPFDVGRLFPTISAALGPSVTRKALGTAVAPFDTAFHDIQGRLLDLPVWAVLGGKHRDRVDFSAYLFYKWAAHAGHEPDPWGAALDPAGIVAQAQRMVEKYGFRSLKLKGGVFPPEQECAAIEALRTAFPQTPLRIDPNANWSVATGLAVAERLDGVLEYLEDPARSVEDMAAIAAGARMPLATNTCVVETGHIPPAIAAGAVQVILADHHYWGGFRASMNLAALCAVFGIGVSMHSNSHLGISLSAMVHLGAAIENLDFAADTHWPWKKEQDDVVVDASALAFHGGSIAVPDTPGLGVEIDPERLERLHQDYVECGIRTRDDESYLRRFDPSFRDLRPRW